MKKILLIVALTILFPALAAAQGNAFNFQGRLNDGTSPANGQYDLQFRLYDAAAGGNQIGPQVLRPRTTLINGVFSIALDFGAAAFANPNSIFIEIAVKPNGSPNAFTILGPRQQLTVVPFASRSQTSTNSDNATNATTALNALNLGGFAASAYVTRTGGGVDFIRNSTTRQPDSNFNISGNGIVQGEFSIGGSQSIVGDLLIGGNGYQASDKGGFVKAMLAVDANGGIIRCYNGTSLVSTGNCGFVITNFLTGVKRINFGFPVSSRFAVVTCEYIDSQGSGINNGGANYRLFNNTTVDVFTFKSGDSADTSNRPFTIILF